MKKLITILVIVAICIAGFAYLGGIVQQNPGKISPEASKADSLIRQ